MSSIVMTTGTEYRNAGPSKTFVFDCDFGTGTASIAIKTSAGTAFKTVKTFSEDEIVSILIPQGAYYRATLTGNAEVVANFDA